MIRILTVVATLLMLPSLSGCLAAAAGAAGAAGGYYVAKDERTAGEIADDAATTARVKARLADDPDVPAMKINVDTYYDVVTLRGHVPSNAVAEKAIKIARSTKDVRGVRSELTVVQ